MPMELEGRGLGEHSEPPTFPPAVLVGNDTFLTRNITQDRKRFVTQPKHAILIK